MLKIVGSSFLENTTIWKSESYNLKIWFLTWVLLKHKMKFILIFFFFNSGFQFNHLKHQPHKMVKHTQTIRRLLPTNCLRVFDHFVGLFFKC